MYQPLSSEGEFFQTILSFVTLEAVGPARDAEAFVGGGFGVLKFTKTAPSFRRAVSEELPS